MVSATSAAIAMEVPPRVWTRSAIVLLRVVVRRVDHHVHVIRHEAVRGHGKRVLLRRTQDLLQDEIYG